MDMQKHLNYLTNLIITRDLRSINLRGVTAFWRERDQTACLTFYFNGPLSDNDHEEYSDLAGGIIAQFPNGLLEEKYIRCDALTPLPESDFWAFQHKENKG